MVVWSRVARDDLRAIYEYIALDSEVYAKSAVRTIVERAATLADMPERGRVVPELEDQRIREIFVFSYRVIHQVSPTGVEVLTVVHGHRDLSGGDIPVDRG